MMHMGLWMVICMVGGITLIVLLVVLIVKLLRK